MTVNEEVALDEIARAHSYIEELKAERDALRAVGDDMQSNASRLLEWLDSLPRPSHNALNTTSKPPQSYEVQMAEIGLRDNVDDWTTARTSSDERTLTDE